MKIRDNILALAKRMDLDLLERVAVVILYGFMTARFAVSIFDNTNYVNLMLLLSEGMVLVFTLFRRRSTNISHLKMDWVLGFAGTLMPLLAMPTKGNAAIPLAYCAVLLLFGFFIQISAKLTLRRSFGVVAANRGVKISGPYAIIRHPMYAGYILTHIAFILSGPGLWNGVIYGLTFCLLVARILVEERLLKQDQAYLNFSAKVPYRLVPFVF